MVNKVYPYGVVELRDYTKDAVLKVNGHRLKPYYDTKENLKELDLLLGDPSDH